MSLEMFNLYRKMIFLAALLYEMYFIISFSDGLFRLTSEDLSYDPRGGTYPKVE